jgi:flagellar biosynthesis chaperone FliJ
MLQTEIQRIKTLRDENEKLIDVEMEKIRTQTDFVANNIQKISNELLNYCKSISAQNEEKLDGKQKEIETYLTQLEASMKDIEDRSRTTDRSKLLQLKKAVESVPDKFQVSEQDLTLHPINFMEGKGDNDVLQSALGEIFLTYSKVTVTKILEAKKGTKLIKYISPISGTYAWNREFKSSENLLINIENGHTENRSVFGETQADHIPDDFITLENGVQVYTWHAGHSVMKMSPPKVDANQISPPKVDANHIFPPKVDANQISLQKWTPIKYPLQKWTPMKCPSIKWSRWQICPICFRRNLCHSKWQVFCHCNRCINGI